jgi:hypothetical protein
LGPAGWLEAAIRRAALIASSGAASASLRSRRALGPLDGALDRGALLYC